MFGIRKIIKRFKEDKIKKLKEIELLKYPECPEFSQEEIDGLEDYFPGEIEVEHMMRPKDENKGIYLNKEQERIIKLPKIGSKVTLILDTVSVQLARTDNVLVDKYTYKYKVYKGE